MCVAGFGGIAASAVASAGAQAAAEAISDAAIGKKSGESGSESGTQGQSGFGGGSQSNAVAQGIAANSIGIGGAGNVGDFGGPVGAINLDSAPEPDFTQRRAFINAFVNPLGAAPSSGSPSSQFGGGRGAGNPQPGIFGAGNSARIIA